MQRMKGNPAFEAMVKKNATKANNAGEGQAAAPAEPAVLAPTPTTVQYIPVPVYQKPVHESRATIVGVVLMFMLVILHAWMHTTQTVSPTTGLEEYQFNVTSYVNSILALRRYIPSVAR